MNLKPIRTDKDHADALREIQRLWANARIGTPDGDRFEVLATLVDAYEREHFPIPAPDPIAAIQFRMEQQSLTPKDLLPVFKTRARTSEVLNRKRHLSLSMIRALHARLGIPLDVLVEPYELGKPPKRRKTKRAA